MRTLSEENYKLTCDVLVKSCNETLNKGNFEIIKASYKNKINSNRRYEKIQDIKDLIHVLEKRDCVSHDNPSVLYEIADGANVNCHLPSVHFRNHELHEIPPNLRCQPNSVQLSSNSAGRSYY